MGFPCFEISPSASNLLITVSDSISTSSLSVHYRLSKLRSFLPGSGGFSHVTMLYPLAGIAWAALLCDLRSPLQAHLE